MAKVKISEFSSTAGNNTDIDGINLAEGMAPSLVNDAIRELMAQLKDFQTGAVGDSFNGPIGTSTAAAWERKFKRRASDLQAGIGIDDIMFMAWHQLNVNKREGRDYDTWLAIDLSPSRKEAALVASQRLEGDKFQVILLQTWHNPAKPRSHRES